MTERIHPPPPPGEVDRLLIIPAVVSCCKGTDYQASYKARFATESFLTLNRSATTPNFTINIPKFSLNTQYDMQGLFSCFDKNENTSNILKRTRRFADKKKSIGDIDLDGNPIVHWNNFLALKVFFNTTGGSFRESQ